MSEQVSASAREPLDQPVGGWAVGVALFAGIFVFTGRLWARVTAVEPAFR
ncbi:hypothetical protein [Nonomuraea lactucae]|nr:hypothetical protein [Nonomuraea lactucae]